MSTAAFRILYVEDNEMLRETIGLLLEADGREVALVTSAEEALAAAAAARFDLVVTDVSLPGISGTQLARQLLEDEPGRAVVLCSGFDMVDAAKSLGPNVLTLAKPFEFEVLDTLISRLAAARPPAT